MTSDQTPDSTPEVVVRRSTRRRRTIQARREEGRIVVLLPAGATASQERQWVDQMVAKVLASERRRRTARGDDQLQHRAERLAAKYLDEAVGRPVRPRSVRWVSNQNHRWGSCTVDEGVIRLTDRLQQMPSWVADYVLVHELTHLVETNHTARFHDLVANYPQAERAKGFLEGWLAGQGRPAEEAAVDG
ncbi:MAG TPA: M48 family metallopeptidase [Candidatus Luteococcus avicola]|nr:M48 family metallopeptidase [Candidatus Luteococcus avicola]